MARRCPRVPWVFLSANKIGPRLGAREGSTWCKNRGIIIAKVDRVIVPVAVGRIAHDQSIAAVGINAAIVDRDMIAFDAVVAKEGVDACAIAAAGAVSVSNVVDNKALESRLRSRRRCYCALGSR